MHQLRRMTVPLALAILGCGSSGPSTPASPLLGHFVAPDPYLLPGLYLALSITSVSPTVAGTGWMAGLQTPFNPLVVTGTLTGTNVFLTLTSGGSPFGTVVGTVTSTSFQGILSRGAGITPAPLTFSRVDTTATGTHSATLSGSVSEQLSSLAGFGAPPTGFIMQLDYPGRNYPVIAISRPGGRPGPGTYQLAPEFSGTVVPAYNPGQRFFAMTAGTLRIDVSTPFALIGQVTIQAQESGSGATLTVVSSFSAVCIVQICQ